MTGRYYTEHVCLDMAQLGDKGVQPFAISVSNLEKLSGIA